MSFDQQCNDAQWILCDCYYADRAAGGDRDHRAAHRHSSAEHEHTSLGWCFGLDSEKFEHNPNAEASLNSPDSDQGTDGNAQSSGLMIEAEVDQQNQNLSFRGSGIDEIGILGLVATVAMIALVVLGVFAIKVLGRVASNHKDSQDGPRLRDSIRRMER